MTQDKDTILDRIRKLLAMAADSTSPNEAAIAAKRARSMMDKHGISLDEIREKSNFGEGTVGTSRKFVAVWEQSIAIAVANYNDCIAGYKYASGGYKTIEFRGYLADVKMCEFMFAMITMSAIKMAATVSVVNGRYNARLGTRFKGGYSSEIVSRLEAMTAERKQASMSTGTDLMVIKIDQVREIYGPSCYTKVSRAVAVREDAIEAERAGRDHGKRVNIHACFEDQSTEILELGHD